MGRRSRKRAAASPEAWPERPEPPARVPARPARRRRGEPRPQPPWGSFPLTELCILVAMVIGVTGLLVWGSTGQLMLVVGAALGSLAGLELSIREHVAGYRSHTTLLSASAAVLTMTGLFLARAPRGVMLAVAAGVFLAGFYGLRELFKRRSGGLGFR